MDATGNAVVIYLHGAAIWANKFSAATGTWGTPGPVDGRSGGDAADPSIAVDKNGQWLAIWQQAYDNTLHGIWQSTSADGVAWTAPTAVTTAGREFYPVLAMNRDGVAVAVWTDTSNSRYTLTGSVRTGQTWAAPHVMKAATDNGDRYAAAAVSGRGEAFVTWDQDDDRPTDAELSVWMAKYSAAGGWAVATLLENYDANQAYSSNIATNAAGQAIFTWIQSTASTVELWERRYTADGALAPAVRITEGTNISWYPAPAVALDDSGTATAAWAFSVRGKNNVYTARAAGGATTWPSPTAMETDNAAADDGLNIFEWATYPHLGSDAAGNVVLIWRKRVGPRADLWGQRFSGGAWGTPTLLETRDTASAVVPRLAVGSGGAAAAVWIYFAEFEIWANILR